MGRSLMESDDSGDVRRLLIYLLLDVSGSMGGTPITSVQEGVDLMRQVLQNTPQAVETVYLAVITFNDTARVTVPLVPITNFVTPHLTADGSTNMTAALDLVNRELDANHRPSIQDKAKGDYKPLVFLLTDGKPNDLETAKQAGSRLRTRDKGRSIGTFLALACGSDSDPEALRQVAGAKNVAFMADMSSANLREFFQWLSNSIKRASEQIGQAASGSGEHVAANETPKDESGTDVFVFDF